MKSKKGFTLVELLAVIVILGVLLLIAVPSITKLITKNKEEIFIINAKNYINQAKLLNDDFEKDLKIYNINQLTDNLTSPYGGIVSGKVAAVKNAQTKKYDYYIFMEDTSNNVIGNITFTGNSVLIKESTLNDNYDVLTKAQIENSSLSEFETYQNCILNPEETNTEECDKYDNDMYEFYNSPLLNANIYDDNDIIIIGNPYTKDAKIFPDYVLEENLQFLTGVGVTINLSDTEKNISGTIINRIDENYFEVLLDEDLYTNTSSIGNYAIGTTYGYLDYLQNKNLWNKAENIRLLAISDFNYFAGLLNDSGKITCTEINCTNTINNENYKKIINVFKIGNLNTRRYNDLLCKENCNETQEKAKKNFLVNYYADTWLMDETICKRNDKNQIEGSCPVIDFTTNKIFVTNNLTGSSPQKSNSKIVVKIHKEFLNNEKQN